MIKPSHSKTTSMVTFNIYSNGIPINTSFRVISIYVHKEINHIGSAKLVIDIDQMDITPAPEMEGDVFIPGKEIRIDVGYHGEDKTIYEGVVTSQSLQINQNARPTLCIECRDYVFPATLSRKNNVFREMKDDDIIRQILAQYPLVNITVAPTFTNNESLIQYYCSDWDFLLSRADASGMVVISDGRSIQVIKPDVGSSSVITLSYGSDILAFNGTLDSTTQTISVDAVAWDSAEQQIIAVSGDIPAVNSQGNITPAKLAETHQQNMLLQTTTAAEQALKSWADAQWFKSAINRYKGTIKFQGTFVVPGSMIELKGLGARFDGNAYIGGVVHEIAEGNWYTTATMGIGHLNNAGQNQVSRAPVSDLLPGTHGLHVGKVLSIENDPAGEGRIQVEIPLLNAIDNRIWARLATFWAGDTHGAFFIPDIGDEVVLGFFNDDPCHAVVLGSLYSSNKKASHQLADENHIRSLVSRSDIKIVFDDEKKSLTFSASGSKIVLSDNGISIESADKLVLSAAAGIEINAGTVLAIEGKSGIKMKGPNIEAKADVAFTAKGNATAELSASGQVTVKGAMVIIN
ncbi:MAG: type VI secretion system tip protein VgrG [Candidatus Pedobacter colombiensis]|uniref:Type VI secretion system tip protein VgrG n=1 Tax=Candidatus Pedobacter colombiensis TaxID=3121371 RepID=A0AAJ6BAU2_9SPHI|nr:type VI secretion system tip protein VgrG [Pedobacter sp.]WEK21618.1 MAG: type VI secretion system tip protein VgrG [Pedobacter sp.]